MRTAKEILAYKLNTTERTIDYYRYDMIVEPKKALEAMEEYAIEYHKNKIENEKEISIFKTK